MEKIIEGAKELIAVAVTLASGVLAGILIVGLVPGDRLNLDVVGSVVLAVPALGLFWLSNRYVNRKIRKTN